MKESVKLSISDLVKEKLENYPYLDEFLREECVNYSALAEKILPEIEKIVGKKKVNKQAIVVSIIRYAKNLKTQDISKEVLKTVASSNLTLKTDIMYLNIPKTIENLKTLESFYQNIKWDKGEIFFIIQGIGEISVVVDKSNYTSLKNKLKDTNIELQFPTSSIIVLRSPVEAAGPGFINFVTKPIAKAGISIEMLTMTRDTIFLVDETNSSKLFEVLKKLIDECRKSLT